MAVEIATPLSTEYLTPDERFLLQTRVATDLSHLGFVGDLIAMGRSEADGSPVERLIEDALCTLQAAPPEGISALARPIDDAVLDTLVLDTQLHRDVCRRMDIPFVHRRATRLLDNWVHPQPITPVNTDELLTIGETDGLTEVIATSFENDFRYVQAIDMLHRSREGSPEANEPIEKISFGALQEALKFLHARSRGLIPQAPAILVDGAWHRMVASDTALYEALCRRIGGGFLKHVPNPLLGEGPLPTAHALVGASFSQLTQHGYNPRNDYWFGTASCQCDSGGHPSC